MHPEPTELLSIVCLTENMSIPRFRNIDTKHQLADILTEGNFTRDEWNNLLHLFNISQCSSICCKNRDKIKMYSYEFSPIVLESSLSSKNLITSSDLERRIAAGKLAGRAKRNSRPDEVPSSQV